jgi:hypothetical protein
MRILRSLVLCIAVALVSVLPGTAFAARPAVDGAQLADALNGASDPYAAFAELSPSQQKAVLEYTQLAYVATEQSEPVLLEESNLGDAITATNSCWTWTWGRTGHNPLGVLLWEFHQRIDWCGNGSTITAINLRKVWGQPHYLWWSYNGKVDDFTNGGAGHASYRAYAMGWFAYRPPAPLFQQDNYPWLDMTAHADGRGTGSGGG